MIHRVCAQVPKNECWKLRGKPIREALASKANEDGPTFIFDNTWDDPQDSSIILQWDRCIE